MNKGIVTTLTASLVLCGTMAMAQPAGSDTKDQNSQHHSKLSKVAFWHHNKDSKNAKPASAKQPKPAQAKTAQSKPATIKQTSAKKDDKPQQVASTAHKPAKPSTHKAGTTHTAKTASKHADEPKEKPPLKQ